MQVLSWRYHETLQSLDALNLDEFDALYDWMIAVEEAEAAARPPPPRTKVY